MRIICCGCGKPVETDDAKGSLKHPYCKECFDENFKSVEEYYQYLSENHL